MEDKRLTSAYCGLFCEACSMYIGTTEDPERLRKLAESRDRPVEELECEGCRSGRLNYFCKTSCVMASCAKTRGIDFCSQCENYPCRELIDFQKIKPHRIELFESLDYAKEHGLEEWWDHMRTRYTCPECRTLNSAYDFACRKCGHEPSNEYVRRNKDNITKML